MTLHSAMIDMSIASYLSPDPDKTVKRMARVRQPLMMDEYARKVIGVIFSTKNPALVVRAALHKAEFEHGYNAPVEKQR